MPSTIRSPNKVWLYLFLLFLVWVICVGLSYFENQSKHTASYRDRARLDREMNVLKQSITHFEEMSKVHHEETQQLIRQLRKEIKESKTKDQGPGTRDQGPGTRDQRLNN